MRRDSSFLAGVIEGFYGPPWSQAERLELFEQMAGWGLDTYMYAPKDDLKHRAIWRELYSTTETADLGQIIQSCQQRGLRFIYALSPGLDIRYTSAPDLDRLKQRFAQMESLGCRDWCLLFDDIPDRMDPADLERWGSLASAQAGVTNEIFRWIRQRQPTSRFLFCPTPYCGRMAERQHGGEGYLQTIGRELLLEIDVFWTGPEIISREITPEHAREVGGWLRRKPLIWDNLHANDYDGRRFFCGPYAGRPREVLGELSGILTNPNCEFALNYIPVRTLAEFVRGEGLWDARAAFLRALDGWWKQFGTVGKELDPSSLALFADCYYLPHEDGPLAQELYRQLSERLSQPPAHWPGQARDLRQQLTRLRDFCAQLAELRNRPLFHVLSRRVWELREELDLIERGLALNAGGGAEFSPFSSDFHLPGTYRGGFVARLQQLLRQRPDGTFVPAGGRAST